jgi:hypothetical protein
MGPGGERLEVQELEREASARTFGTKTLKPETLKPQNLKILKTLMTERPQWISSFGG